MRPGHPPQPTSPAWDGARRDWILFALTRSGRARHSAGPRAAPFCTLPLAVRFKAPRRSDNSQPKSWKRRCLYSQWLASGGAASCLARVGGAQPGRATLVGPGGASVHHHRHCSLRHPMDVVCAWRPVAARSPLLDARFPRPAGPVFHTIFPYSRVIFPCMPVVFLAKTLPSPSPSSPPHAAGGATHRVDHPPALTFLPPPLFSIPLPPPRTAVHCFPRRHGRHGPVPALTGGSLCGGTWPIFVEHLTAGGPPSPWWPRPSMDGPLRAARPAAASKAATTAEDGGSTRDDLA